jgi:thiosulfate dehydrogenase
MKLVNFRRLSFLLGLTTVVTVVVLATTSKARLIVRPNELLLLNGFSWQPPDTASISTDSAGNVVRYGLELVANTSFYLGPKGSVAQITNGMNCQNCHLDAGTRLWGNNYSAVFSTYPKFRDRSGTIEDIFKRINDCVERSLNGHPLDGNSRELRAIAAYITWLGKEVPRKIKPNGAGIRDLDLPGRAANPESGREVFMQKCQRCHGADGQGKLKDDGLSYTYPPLWGKNSYNQGAGLYRISRFAGFVRDNMPFDAPYNSAPLTDEEAWDVAAFVNSQPRPAMDVSKDYPNKASKPFDYPFAPYADNFTEYQHKYGPFQPIRDSRKSK